MAVSLPRGRIDLPFGAVRAQEFTVGSGRKQPPGETAPAGSFPSLVLPLRPYRLPLRVRIPSANLSYQNSHLRLCF